MPALALPAFWYAVAAGAGASGAIIGAHMSASANEHAADLQSTAAHETLTFEQQQAARDQANFEAAQKANYGQWAAREGRLSDLGTQVGLPARNIPAYVPTSTGGTSQPGSPGSYLHPTASSASAGGNPRDPAYIDAQLTAYYQSRGLSPTGPGSGPTDIAYMRQQILANGGWDPNYWPGRIDQELGRSGGRSAGPASSLPGSPGSYLLPSQRATGPTAGPMTAAPVTPALTLPPAYMLPQQLGTVGSYFGA